MKRLSRILLLPALLLFLPLAWSSFQAFGDDPSPPPGVQVELPAVTPGTSGAGDLTALVGFDVVAVAKSNPLICAIGLLSFAFRAAFKPLMTWLDARVKATATEADDRLLARLKANAAFVWLDYLVDHLGSIKLVPILLVLSRVLSRSSAESTRALAFGGILLAMGASGCATSGSTGTTTLSPERLEKITRVAVWSTATAWTIQNPGTRPAFQASLRGIDALVAEQQWDLVALTSSLSSSGANKFTGDEARLIISGTTLLVDTFAGGKVDLSNQEYVRAIILGSQAGLRLALTGSSPPPPESKPTAMVPTGHGWREVPPDFKGTPTVYAVQDGPLLLR